ncbi:MAG: metallopeptidase, partial [Alphaproteobacteria bacterium]|nr:metallopeptidase [Alphaproteobacteria bacterium]
ITANPGAIVTAPDPGTIRFAGPFRQYKLLVIIQHDNGEHSLLGGLQELYTSVGAKVVKGEPLGKLPPAKSSEVKMEGDSGPATSLYYERRRNGKPIDPRKANG